MSKPSLANPIPGATGVAGKIAVVMAMVLAALLFLGTKPAEAQTLTIEPGTLDLGGLEVGVTTDPVSVTVTNPSTSLVEVSLEGVSITGPNAADFTLLTPVAGLTLAPGESQVLEFAVNPSAQGPLSASLNVPLVEAVTGLPIVSLPNGLPAVLGLVGEQPLSLVTNVTGTGVAPNAANTKPTVTIDEPAGNKVQKRKPTIVGTVTDSQEELDKADIKVFLKGKEITNFTYDQATDKVQFKPDKKLKRGKKYTVRITATDAQGLTGSAEKTFKVKKRR